MITNYLQRDREPRETMCFIVSIGVAKDILETYSDMVKTSAKSTGYLTRMKTGYYVQVREFAKIPASKGGGGIPMKKKRAPKLTLSLLNNPGSDVGILSGFATADNPQ